MPSIDRLSPEEMDKCLEKAAIALKSLPQETIQTVAVWWKQWYMTTGHKRLGRLLLIHTNKKKENHAQNQNSLPQGLKANTISSGLIFTFSEAPQDTAAMFSVEYQGAEVRIILNTLHLAYSLLRGILSNSGVKQQDQTNPELRDADNVIKLLLIAWSRYECNQIPGKQQHQVEEARIDWGRASSEQMRQFELEG